TDLILGLTVAGSTPSSTWRVIESYWPFAPRTGCGDGGGHGTRVAPDKPWLSPSPTSAVTVAEWVPVSVSTWTLSPTLKSFRSAVALSMATWSMPEGGVPALIVSPDSGVADHETPNVG